MLAAVVSHFVLLALAVCFDQDWSVGSRDWLGGSGYVVGWILRERSPWKATPAAAEEFCCCCCLQSSMGSLLGSSRVASQSGGGRRMAKVGTETETLCSLRLSAEEVHDIHPLAAK